jgi:tetratricopeptide (TPR) repeat protein
VASQLERHRERFASDPSDRAAFEALEEHYFLHGAWTELTALYERFLESEARLPAREEARLRFRLGQVLEERRLDSFRATACYREAARFDPSFRPPLSQLRRLHAGRGQWEVALQIAELEAQAEMRPYERAEFLCEMGTLWHRQLSDAGQALAQYREALEAVPEHLGSLLGLASALGDLGQAQEAAEAWERVLARLQGPDRAPALEALARLVAGPLSQPDRALELYRDALREDPRRESTLEALIELESNCERWAEVASLLERRFDLSSGARRRAAIALQAGRIHLEPLQDAEKARHWLERARELGPEDPDVYIALAEVARQAGDPQARARHLEKALTLGGAQVSGDVVLETARLALQRGETEHALERLRGALREAPDDPSILATLSEALAPLGRDEELVDVLERRAVLAGEDASARAALLGQIGSIYEERLSEPESALDAYRRAFDMDPGQPGLVSSLERLYAKLERWEGLRDFLESACPKLAPEQQVGVLCSLGEFFTQRLREEGKAARAFEQALALVPSEPRALGGLARLATEQGDSEALVQVYDREAAVTQDVERLGWLVGEIVRSREERGELERARPWVERWERLAPEDRHPLETLAHLQEALGENEALVQTLERLDALLPGEERAANRRRLGFLHASMGHEAKALQAWRFALEADPDDAGSLRALLNPLERRADYAELAEVRRRLAPLLPAGEARACRLELARLLAERLGDVDQAIALLRELSGEPEAPQEAAPRLEELLERAGRYDELAERWQARRETLPADSAEGLALDLQRAELQLERLGQHGEAVRLYRRVLELQPTHHAASTGLERALRAADDVSGLVEFLGERAGEENDPGARAALALERAALLEERLGRDDEARSTYEALVEQRVPNELASQALCRLEALLRRVGDHAALADRLEARLADLPWAERAELHARVAELALQGLGNPERACRHLETALEIEPQRADLWRDLARLHEDTDRPAEWLHALEGELETSPSAERELTLRAKAARLLAGPLGERERAADHYRRILELDPTHMEAAEFEAVRLEHGGRFEELAALLKARLEALEPGDAPGVAEARPEDLTALRLRLAALRADRLGDVQGAIRELESAIGELGPLAVVAEPLADLYQRAGRVPELMQLCERAGAACESPLERADWNLRLGEALRRSGQSRRAAETYRSVLVGRPDDGSAHTALRDLYRELGETEPLTRLLEAELDRVAGPDEIPFRRELVLLLEGPLERPEAALVHLRRLVEIDPSDGPTREHSIDLAEQLGRASEALELLEASLLRTQSAPVRARLQARRGALLAGPLRRPQEALGAYREALRLDPHQNEVRRALRETLESLGLISEALACLQEEVAAAAPAERAVLLVHAAHLAESQVSAEAALPWLERLRALQPEDPHVLLRLAGLHRHAGRTEVWLRTVEEAARYLNDPAQRRDLHREGARVLEQELGSPQRAIAALEEARRLDPRHLDVLAELERLYTSERRAAELADVLEAQLELSSERERRQRLVRLAELYAGPLHAPQRSAAALRAALAGEGLPPLERMDVLRRLGDALRGIDQIEEYARVAEEELEALPPEPVFTERRRVVHEALARSYEEELARPAAALPHLRALLEGDSDPAAAGAPEPETEERLIRILRSQGALLELSRRLAMRIERRPEDVEAALELARLREEQLWAPAAAAHAYRRALQARPGLREALRGLRRTGERLGDWRQVARALEGELALDGDSRGERAALWRRLGEVCWKRLAETTQASRAFAAALEADPSDLQALRALQQLCEGMEDWRGALDFYASEIDLLGEAQSERRQTVWLRIGELAGDRVGEHQRAARAFEEAARLGRLPPERQAQWAQILLQSGDLGRHADVFQVWCDDPESGAEAHHHLDLAQTFLRLERPDQARTRVERALELDRQHELAWELAARLREDKGDVFGAAEAWVQRAGLTRGRKAATALLSASRLLEGSQPSEVAEWLERAVLEDPALACAHALRARVAYGLGRSRVAEESAARALELDAATGELGPQERSEAALVGARAALLGERYEEAGRHADALLSLEPDHPEGLSMGAEARFRLGDLPAARRLLETLISQGAQGSRGAHHLLMLAATLEASGELEAALRCYGEALEIDSDLEAAHAGRTRLLQQERRHGEAAEALQRWADHTGDAASRADRLVAAADHLHEGGEPPDRWEGLLREAVTLDPSFVRGWERLATCLWAEGRADDALLAAERGLEHACQPEVRAGFWKVRAQALESRGSERDAAEAYRELAGSDPQAVEAALSGARLLRAVGEWTAAAELLDSFAERHPGGDPGALSRVFLQLGRLLAGPLESMEGAIEAYRRAVSLNPELQEAREALAGLLVHTPVLRDEAVALHRALLEQDPTRTASLRALLHTARERGATRTVRNGLAILQALGVISPEERESVGDGRLAFRIALRPALSKEPWERLRLAARQAADALAEALHASHRAQEPPSEDPVVRYQTARLAAEAELAAPALVPLSEDELGETLRLLARLTLDPESVRGDGNLVNALSNTVGRRLRRRLKRAFGDTDPSRFDAIDFAAWRAELRALGAATALDASGGDLRAALLALLADGTEIEVQALAPEADLTPWVASCPEARDLLGRVVRAWTEGL